MCTFTHSLRKRFVVSLSYLNGLFRFSRHKIPSIHDHSQCTRCVACFNVLWSFISPSFRTCARVNGTPLSSKSGYIRGDAQLVNVFFSFSVNCFLFAVYRPSVIILHLLLFTEQLTLTLKCFPLSCMICLYNICGVTYFKIEIVLIMIFFLDFMMILRFSFSFNNKF